MRGEDYIDIFDKKSKPRRKLSKGLVLVLIIISLASVGGIGVFAYNSYMSVSTPTYTVNAETLGELKKKTSQLQRKLTDAIKEVNKLEKQKKKNNGLLHPFKEAEIDKKLKNAKEGKEALERTIKGLQKRIFSSKEQKKVAQAERDRAANERDGGKEFADAEWERTQKAEVDALNDTSIDSEGNSGSGASDSAGSSGNKAESKSSTKDKKPVKTVSNYQGGTSNGVNKEEQKREYVEDSRRTKTDAIRFISDDPATGALMDSITNTVNSSVGGKYLMVYSTDGMLSFSNILYRPMSDEDKRKVMELALKTVKESQLPNKVKTKVTNFITEQDKTTADVIQALNSDTSWELSRGYSWFIPFTGSISTFFGFLSIVIFVFLSASIVFDIAYLTVGVFRAFLDNGEGKPKLITAEAWETSKEVDISLQSGTYREYLGVYFKKRVSIFVITAIVLIYLISGQIYDISSWFLKVFEEVFRIRG